MNDAVNTTGLDQWLTFEQFPQVYTTFSKAQIEWLHRNRELNGFGKAFRKVGKLRYIHAGIFAECLIENV
jgi:hypothetical protein